MKKLISLILSCSILMSLLVFTSTAEEDSGTKTILFTPDTNVIVTSGASYELLEKGYIHVTSNAGGSQHIVFPLGGLQIADYPYIVFDYRYTNGADYNSGVELVSTAEVHSGLGGNLLVDGQWHSRILYLPSLISGFSDGYEAKQFILPVPNMAGYTVDISRLSFCRTAEDAEAAAGNVVPLEQTCGVYLPNSNNIIGIQTSASYSDENGYLTVTRTEGDKSNDAHISFMVDVNPVKTPYLAVKYRLNDSDYSDPFSHLATNGGNYAEFNYPTPLTVDGQWHTAVYYLPKCFPTVINEHINGLMFPAPWNLGGTMDIGYIRFFENIESVEAFCGECDHHDAVNGICPCGWIEPASVSNVDQAEYYKIANAGNLIDFGKLISTSWLGKELNAMLTADIDLSDVCSEETGIGWTPIVSNGSRGWRGTFNGNGHTISNLYVNDPNGTNVGLFTKLVRTDNISPVIENLILTGTVIGGSSTGGICGRNDGGIIRNCLSLVRATGTVTSETVGSICGYTDSGLVENCFYMYGETGYQGEAFDFGANGESGTISDVYKMTADEFASGKAAYLLNGSEDAGSWKQMIGKDDLPSMGGCSAGNVYKDGESFVNKDGHTLGAWAAYDADKHIRVCECGYAEYADHVWDQGTVLTEATHETDGEMVFRCTECGAEKHEKINKLPEHSFGDWKREDENQHKRICECGEVEYATHNWNTGEVTIEPTSRSEGQLTYTCMDCLAVKYVPIEKLPEETTPEETTAEETTAEETTAEETTVEETTAEDSTTDETTANESDTEETIMTDTNAEEDTDPITTTSDPAITEEDTHKDHDETDESEGGGCSSSIGLAFLMISMIMALTSFIKRKDTL